MKTSVTVLPDNRIDRKNAAAYIGVKVNTLNVWNSIGKHDEYFQKIVVAGKVYYDFDNVKAFCERDRKNAA